MESGPLPLRSRWLSDYYGNLTQKGSLRGAVKLRFHATRPHQITSYGPQGTEHAVAYDTAGRMASRVIKTGATAAAAKSESYFFEAVDRLTRVVVHTGTGRYVSGAVQESTTRHWYDAEGRRVRTQVTAGTTTSNTHHLFAEVEVRDGEMTKYYFAGGLRIAGRISTPSAASSAGDLLAGAPFRGVALPPGVAVGLALVLLLLLLSPGLRGPSRWRVLLVPTRVVATAAFFWLALLPPGLAKVALPGDVTLWHYHVDHLGSTHSITDASGNLYRQTRTTAYGEVRGRYDGSGNVVAAEVALRHEFTGYQSEEKSGLQYAGARYYLPELGVFTSHDPAGQFPSPYAYGPGDPVNGTDPTGSFFTALLIGLAVATAVAFARAIYAGVKTGNWGGAFAQFGIDMAIARAATVITAGISAGLQALQSVALSTAYEVVRAGYTAYSFALSIRTGDTLGAVTAGLSLVATAYGFVEDQFGSNTSKVVSGQRGNSEREGFRDPGATAADFSPEERQAIFDQALEEARAEGLPEDFEVEFINEFAVASYPEGKPGPFGVRQFQTVEEADGFLAELRDQGIASDRLAGRAGRGSNWAKIYADAITSGMFIRAPGGGGVTTTFGSFVRGAKFVIYHEFAHGPLGIGSEAAADAYACGRVGCP